MEVKLIRIGNSRGIRIPKKVLDQVQAANAFELKTDGEAITLKPVRRKPREGWAEMAEAMSQAGDDALLIPDAFEDEDEVEW